MDTLPLLALALGIIAGLCTGIGLRGIAIERRVAQLVADGMVSRDAARHIVELEADRRWTAVPSRPQGSDDE